MTSQKGSTHVVIVSVLVIALLGALGFIFWQNFLKKYDAKQATTTSTQTTKTETTPTEEKDTKKYVTIDTFGVKFDAPSDGTTIEYAGLDGSDGNSVGFVTSNLTKQSPDAGPCNAEHGASGVLERSPNPYGSETTGANLTKLNDNKPINGYYYRFTLPNGQSCDNTNPSDEDEAKMIEKLAETIQSAE